MKLSAVILAKNEEKRIGSCIDSVSFADEVLVIDNGSTDHTIKIAKNKNAKVIVKENDNFAELRNHGIEEADGEWILYVDADERVSTKLQKSIKDTILKKHTASAYKLKRKNYYLGNYEWPYIEKVERLFLKNSLKKWIGAVHESPVVDGKIEVLVEGYLLHYTHRTLEEMLEKTNAWSEIEADLLVQSRHPEMNAFRFVRIMLTKFIDSYVKQKGFKAGTVGLVESIYQAFSYFVVYAKLWERQIK